MTVSKTTLYARAFGLWLVFLVMAVAAGAAREFVLGPAVGDLTARQINSVFLCLAYLPIMRIFIVRRGLKANRQLLALGAFWCGLTFLFETSLGLASGASPRTVFQDYDLSGGRLWPLVLLTLLLGPWLMRRVGK